MRNQVRQTSSGDVVRVIVGVVLIVIGLAIWGQNAADLHASLNGARSSLSAAFLVILCIVGGVALVLIGLLWRGPERRR